MSRLRTIKPGFFLDDELAECCPLARLLFAGLWTIADRDGRLRDRPKKIKAETLPYDECDVDALLDELASHGTPEPFIVRYEADGVRYIAVPGWHKHQNPHVKEAPSTIPAPDKHSARHNLNRDEPCRSCLGSCLGSWDLELGLNPLADASAPADADDDVGTAESAHFLTRTADYYTADFAEWWTAYGRIGSKADAAALYRHWRERGASAEELLAAAEAYRAHCAATDCKMAHARTFLAKKPNRWREWASGERHGDMDVRATERLADVFDTAAEAFGLNGGRDDNGSRRQLTGGPTRASQRRAHAGGGVPAGELEAGE